MKNLLRRIGRHLREKSYYYVCAVVTLGLLAMGLFRFPNAIGRLVESCRDFGLSVAYCFCDLFGIEKTITPTVNDFPDYTFLNVKTWFYSLFTKPSTSPSIPSTPSPSVPLPTEWAQFAEKWNSYWQKFVELDNLLLYVYYVVSVLAWVAPAILILIPLWKGIKKLFNRFYFKEMKVPETEDEQKDETRPIKESRLLRLWHRFYFAVIVRVLLWFVGLIDFIKEREELHQFWLLLVLLYFNVLTIFIEFSAYYVYFIASFDFVNLYRQLYKLLLDLSSAWSVLWWIVWLTIGYLALNRWAKYVYWERVEREKRDMEEFLGDK